MILPPKRSKPAKPTPLDKLLAEPAFAKIPVAIVQHGQVVPLGVMVRGTMEWMLDEATLEKLFQEHAPEQYTRELTISALVRLLIQVSAGERASVYAAYKADQASAQPTIETSYQAVYGKLGRINPAVSEAVVVHSAQRFGQLLDLMPRARSEPLRGYRMRVLDGNVLTGTDHRLTPLRQWLNACLPGKSLVVYEPGLGLVTTTVLCEDAYVQERALLTEILPRVQANDLFVEIATSARRALSFAFSSRRPLFWCDSTDAAFPVQRSPCCANAVKPTRASFTNSRWKSATPTRIPP